MQTLQEAKELTIGESYLSKNGVIFRAENVVGVVCDGCDLNKLKYRDDCIAAACRMEVVLKKVSKRKDGKPSKYK